MGTFRRVEAEAAGPDAVGILIPPAKRTFVILRPRALPWDLLVCRSPEDLSFADLAHDEASACAQGLYRALRSEAVVIEPVATGVRVCVGEFALVVCGRVPGKAYQPVAAVDERLRAVLCPVGEQEVYFNTRFFGAAGG